MRRLFRKLRIRIEVNSRVLDKIEELKSEVLTAKVREEKQKLNLVNIFFLELFHYIKFSENILIKSKLIILRTKKRN